MMFHGFPDISELPEQSPLLWEVWQERDGTQTFLGYQPDYWTCHAGDNHLRQHFFSTFFGNRFDYYGPMPG